MTKEHVFQDKIHLLMEETGCEQGEAELAMTSVGYDLEKAIRTIGVLLRNIVVVKAKFHIPPKNHYGLLILIMDTKKQRLFRIRAVVSYNPALFETPLNEDWYVFEKGLYAFRLWEGSLQQVSQDFEKALWSYFKSKFDNSFNEVLKECDEEKVKEKFMELIKDYFSLDSLNIEALCEELNLRQFRHIKPKGEDVGPVSGGGPSVVNRPNEPSESLLLDIKLHQDSSGIRARDIKLGDSVGIFLVDERDIAQYLSKLLGGRNEKGMESLVVPVEEIQKEGEMLHFQVRLSTGILGVAEIHQESLIRAQKRTPSRWWHRIIPQ